jgi:hypothetical protein
LKQLIIPDTGSDLVSKFQADFAASNAKFNASLISLFGPKASSAPQPVAPVTSIASGTSAKAAGLVLPKHRIGEFRDRLAAPLPIAEA